MTLIRTAILALLLCLLAGAIEQSPPAQFGTVDLYVDSAQQPLAAWQMEFKATTGHVEIVGIERGDNADFHDPPYYDPAALKSNRVIVGAFDLADRLPSGKTRVARLHLHISGPDKPVYAVNLVVAGDKAGKPIVAQASFSEGEAK